MSERWAALCTFSPTLNHAECGGSDLATHFRDLEIVFSMESLASTVFANYS
jgi:hypothetical protein